MRGLNAGGDDPAHGGAGLPGGDGGDAWRTVLAAAARSLPGTDPDPALPNSDEPPEALARRYGLVLVAVPPGANDTDGSTVIVAPDGARWLAVPRLDASTVGQVPGWIARRWVAAVLVPTLLAAVGASLAMLALGRTVATGGFVPAVLTVAGAGIVAVAIGVATRRAARLGVALALLARLAVLASALRQPTVDDPANGPILRIRSAQAPGRPLRDDRGDDASGAVLAGPVMASAIRVATAPLVLVAALVAASVTIVAAGVATPLVPIRAVAATLLIGAATVGLCGPVFRRSVRAQESADLAREALVQEVATRVAGVDAAVHGADSDAERHAEATLAWHRRARLASAPVIVLAAVLPVALGTLALAVTDAADTADTADTAERVASVALAIALGAALGIAAETAMRLVVTLAPVAVAWRMFRALPPEAVRPAVASTGEVTLERAMVTPGMAPMSLTIAPGERWQLVHPDPARRTALAETIAGLREPIDGTVRFGDHDAAAIDLAWLRRGHGWVAREPVLRGDDLGAVVFGASQQPDAARRDALLARAGLAEVVAGLPLGLSTPMVDGGAGLGAPVRLRLALARALAREPRLTVIDAALDEVDAAPFDDLLASWPGTLVIVSAREASLVPGIRVRRVDDDPPSPGAMVDNDGRRPDRTRE